MTFRPIGIVLADVIGRLEMQAGSGCSDERAPTPAHPDTRGTELREAGCPEGAGGTRPMRNTAGGIPVRNSLAKRTGANPGQFHQVVRNRAVRPSRDWQAISASLMDIIRNKCAAAPQGSPTLAAHLFLVIDHDTAPKALRAFKTARANATSVIPAMKP